MLEKIESGGDKEDRGQYGWMTSPGLNGHEFEQTLRDSEG